MNSIINCAEIALNDCLNLRRQEQLLIICDTFCSEIGRALYVAGDGKCKETILVMVQSRKYDGSVFPEIVADIIPRFDCVAIATQRSFALSLIEQTVQTHSIRIATLPGITQESFCRTMQTDWRKLGVYTRKIAGRAGVAGLVRVISSDSAELTFRCDGVSARADDGRIMSAGTFGNLPGGEVCLRPLDGTANGTLVINESFSLAEGTLTEPLVLTFRSGAIVKVEGNCCQAELEKIFVKNRSGARSLIEFGIGTNDCASFGSTIVEDKKVRGAVHAGIGGGDDLPVHLDGVIRNASVWFDEKQFVDSGTIC